MHSATARGGLLQWVTRQGPLNTCQAQNGRLWVKCAKRQGVLWTAGGKARNDWFWSVKHIVIALGSLKSGKATQAQTALLAEKCLAPRQKFGS